MYALMITGLLLFVWILVVVLRNWGRIATELTERGETIYDDPLDPEGSDPDAASLSSNRCDANSQATRTVR